MSPNYRRRRIIALGVVGLVLAAIVGGTGYVSAALAAPIPEVSPAIMPTAAVAEALVQPAAAPVWPGYGSGAIGMVGSDELLSVSGNQGVVPIASITKVVTSLVVLDAKPLAAGEVGPEIEYTDRDVEFYYDELNTGGSVAPVVNGLVLTERQSLEALLLASGNNYSISLAVWAYGSVDAFLEAANAWLSDRGLVNTHLADASGVLPESSSTVTDLVTIGKLALAHPVLAEIVAMPSTELPVVGTIENTNKLLGELGVNGMKTGTTDEAGACLLFTSDFVVGEQTVTLVGVLLGADTHPELNDDVRALLGSVQAGFHEVPLTEAGVTHATYGTVWGQSASAVTTEPGSLVLWSDTPVSIAVQSDPIQLATAGTVVGSITFTAGEQTVIIPLAVDSTISDPGSEWRLTNPGVLADAGKR